ncbi:vacuolar protein sorting-associated protein 13D isoform X2 [Harmonia axyridis]|uniref:vacuolar protein sorting-associated protein 13D isoform X2 n=1 Tax=Harmonia axyridis TaxID=115357 RepID=UPI001E275D03|nr:vacuolar protein sorting-associated protein 13D isoform X2 [Harmonia axyridis]
MLEGLAAWILNTYLGKYVDLNTDQLSIALLSGKVELENLPLKKDALRHLGLPVEIKAGFIGKIKLQIPVSQIRSAPWVIAIEQLYLVASPLPISEWDNEAEENARQEIKLTALDKMEAHWRLENDTKDINTYYSTTYSSWINFGAGVISDIIENIQLNIEDVHIRYEDNISVNNKSVAFGVTIDSLSAQSCDANWSPRFCHLEKEGESFKLLEMQKFGIYWEDLAPERMLAHLSLADLAIAMSPFATLKNIKNFILPPVSTQAHIKNNHSEQPLRSTDTPRFACDLVLDDVPITLIDWQYDQVVKCIQGLDDLAKYRRYRIYQPSKTVKEDPRSWWIYAINCLYPGGPPRICKPKPTWESCLNIARENVLYVKIYNKILISPTVALSSEDKKFKDKVEKSREFEELKVLREIAMKTVKLPKLKSSTNNSAGRSMLENWFPGWIGWYSSAPPENETSETSSPEVKQLEGEILQVLSDSVENNTIFKRDAVFGKFNFCLKKGSVNLCTTMDGEISPMLELEFKNLSLNIVSKPRTQAHLVELSLGALYLKDKITQNSLFSVLVGPPGLERGYVNRSRGPQSPRVSVVNQLDPYNECLFYIAYEKKPSNSTADYRLCIQSKCLDIVYQPSAIKWLIEFLCLPHKKNITQSRIEAMKSRTKKELMKNWEQILGGRMVDRTTWDLQFDISAPQIFFVENFCDQGASMAVIDFGRLQLKNNTEFSVVEDEQNISKASEEEETFLTPCSTPPQSEASDSEDHTLDISNMEPLPSDVLNETTLHQKIYERYTVELTDLQILVGKVKDNWRYAHNKGSSTLHVLDRFNISVQVERRVIHTVDPLYPSLTFNANLPKLVAHLNESKVNSARKLLHIITTTGLPSPFKSSESLEDSLFESGQDEEPSMSMDTSLELSKLLMVQFIVDHMSLEVQSRGRSVAELQVSGVKVALMRRSIDMSVTLTVHSLLLVDALQTFGADFELLVASHKHVGMDSMSGSLRDSEPTSPMSPASPDPNISRPVLTSPMALTQALTSLTASPMNLDNNLRTTTVLDAEALITIEVIIISGQEPMQIANVQFNNLDIIANQETLVELVGFARRVFPKSQKSSNVKLPTAMPSSVRASNDSLPSILEPTIGKTELTFDFHRLNVLLLRGIMKDGILHGKKICTATMSGAKIQATVSSKVEIEGSLGGLQVLDLTPEGQMHQRIVSVGKDLLQEDQIHPLYASALDTDKERAFSFKVVRSLDSKDDKDVADIKIRMASLWYTHSPHFVCELQSCATEFKQYMSHLARSIKIAATDMALGLVQARAEALAQSLYMNARLSSSIYGSAFSLSECSSPRKRRRSSSIGASGFSSARDTIPQTPYSPDDTDDIVIDIKLDIILDSPVVVLPRGHNSTEVFIAHLGRINVFNKNVKDNSSTNGSHQGYSESRTEFYEIEIRDMNLFSLDTSSRRSKEPRRDQAPMVRPEVLYSCDTLAKPILHDTLVKLSIEREVTRGDLNYSNESLLPFDDDELSGDMTKSNIQITGSVVTALKVSLTRMQYEQVLDTMQWLTSNPKISESVMRSLKPQSALGDITEEDTGVTTLNMDPHVRAKLFPAMTNVSKTKSITSRVANIKVSFELPIFTIELRGNIPSTEQGLIDVSFRDFVFCYEKSHRYETNIQVSLRSIYMEDLLQPQGSRQRAMMISSSGGDLPPNASCMSRSCPDITYNQFYPAPIHGSLPDHLETSTIFGMANNNKHGNFMPQRMEQMYPSTPPPSPTQRRKSRMEKNLVLISVLLVDKDAPNFNSLYDSLNMTASVDFNCLDLVISVESWVVLIDFFSASPTSSANDTDKVSEVTDNVLPEIVAENIGTNITIRSLTMVLVKSGSDIAKANISKVEIGIKTSGAQKEVEGTLGSMSLIDLTPHGQLYKERFTTSGSKALKFKYTRHTPVSTKNYDAHLEIGMSSVLYVHTKRFVAELQAFSNHFTQLQRVMESIRAATSGQKVRNEPLKLSLSIYAGSPIILVPVSSKSSDMLVVNLGQLLVKNRFRMSGDQNTISVASKQSNKRTILDVMSVELQNMDLFMGRRENGSKAPVPDSFQLGTVRVFRNGPSLLTKKFQVKFRVERNLLNFHPEYRIVPDMSIYGQLSTLDATIDSSQYRLLKGLFTFNLGEDTERILPSVTSPITSSSSSASDSWTLSSLKLDLQNVTLRLRENSGSPPFTCINFIKSRLTVESFNNLSQDIDLVSQEILVMDTRFDHSPGGHPPNVFTNILQPVKKSNQVELVQAEIHSRKRGDHTKFTVLLNNMRLMGVFDWWETLQKFIFQNIENVDSSPEHQKMPVTNWKPEQGTFEVKLNITDSELVVVENTAQWDTNAVILKSTTVITYKPKNVQKPLSCNLNHCEMFSCILGMEDETALSIIDPITLNIDINGDNKLEAQLQYLTVRLSYHDMKMFLQILNSLPKQLLSGQKTNETLNYSIENVNKLVTLGFSSEDCITALEKSANKLDEAAIWLTKYATPKSNVENYGDLKIAIDCIEVKANCVSLCIIDDCGDSDVPLLEFSLKDLCLTQNLLETDNTELLYRKGSLSCILASDYYNRVLSGWEPVIEPWNCTIIWHKTLSAALVKNRLNVEVRSKDILNVDVTSTLLDLYKKVKESWTKDYYSLKDKNGENGDNECKQICQSPTFKRRSPFVPFALKNDTGSVLHFSTVISEVDDVEATQSGHQDDSVITVPQGATVPFSFSGRDKIRHQDSHKRKMHQLIVKVDGWQQATPPVSVDKVGVYFRHALIEVTTRSNIQADIPPARIIFDITLEGSARKLITVRSAVLAKNKLPETVELKFESQYLGSGWVPSKSVKIDSGKTLAIPLQYAHSDIDVRPVCNSEKYSYCSSSISWKQPNSESVYDLATCVSKKGTSYRFCSDIVKEKFVIEGNYKGDQPAHRITLLPTVKIVNLLPIDLIYRIKGEHGRIVSGSSNALTSVDPDETIELNILVENFVSSTSVIIPAACATDFACRLRLEDNLERKLFLQAVISCNKGAKIKISISAPYWIINKTGLPLVFRQAGTSSLSAGQFEEHEFARMLLPLLFSFSDHDASPTISARVGNHVIRDGTPQWCSNFHVQKGIQVRKLHVTMTDGRSDTVFVVGIEVRPGKGRYRSTNIVTISPRYQVHNRSSYQLVFCQSYFTLTLSNPNQLKTSLRLMPNSHMPFHWPRLDQDQYLCVSIKDIPDCCWSGGLKIDANSSTHVNIRDTNGRVYFLRLEIVLQGATFFIVFTDADTMPPPIRVDNFSEVSLTFAQSSCKEVHHSTARAHSSIPYAWDQPTQPPLLNVVAPGGISKTYDMSSLGPSAGLTYENFIYIAFVGTFKSDILNPLDVENQELVLDVINGTQVVLARKRQGLRSQLWRMTSTGHIQHEGSSPPYHPNQPRSEHVLVLDIEGNAPQPSCYSRLMLRRMDPRRVSTQLWRFTDDGLLCCAHYNMCVQAQDGFYGLRQGNTVVLGLPSTNSRKLTDAGVPIEQAVGRQRLRPGSGFLSVDIIMDGPTRVLVIKDMKEKKLYATSDDREWGSIALQQRPHLDFTREEETDKREFQFIVHLQGLGVSLVCCKTPEELLYGLFSNIVAETVITPKSKMFCVSVGNVQVDNQLFETTTPVVLYVTPPNIRNSDEGENDLPAIMFQAEMQTKVNENAVIFKYLILRLKNISVILEELLLLKFCSFAGFHSQEEELINKDENDFETQRLLTKVSTSHSKRYYFGVLQLVPSEIRLSVKTASKLSGHLQRIKKKLGLTLIKFEDAAIDLQAFDRKHPFETWQFLLDSIKKHFRDELMWQAGIILGSVDFLGNPLGFVNDVSEGLSGFFLDGNVSALVKNVTHGISNSAAKVTESLSDGLGKVAMDDRHEETRQRYKRVETGRSKDHLIAGFKGLGFGLLGGATSIFKQVYEGVANDGIQGAFSGMGKGLVGALTKPVVGVLDFASETARAVRDSSSSKIIFERHRLPRCVHGYGGLLPRYNLKQSQGQQYLYTVNDKNYNEQLIAFEVLGSASEDLQCIVSNERIRIVANNQDLTPIIDCHLINLISCKLYEEKEHSENRYYIEIVQHVAGTSSSILVNPDPVKKPRVRCRSMELARTVAQQINYAKRLYTEYLYTLNTDNTAIED